MRCLTVLIALLSGSAVGYVGRVDTIGGTTYDWQLNGPQSRRLACSRPHGIHATWQYSADSGRGFYDRNMAYNYYDFATRQWAWIDTNHMRSGMVVFGERAGYGNLAVHPQTGAAIVSAHRGSVVPMVGRDIAPGAGIFEFCDGAPTLDGFQWPCLGVTQPGTMHLALVDAASSDGLWHSAGRTWCNWSEPTRLEPDPAYPDHCIATSRVSGKVCVTWVENDAASPVSPGYYAISTDDGLTWQSPVELEPPDVFGGDTVESWAFVGLFPFYDSLDRLHVTGPVIPVVHDTGYIDPIVIAHWCPANTPEWSTIARVDPDFVAASVGYNALFADRPTLGEDRAGNLLVAWEQADPLNVEPVTNLLRFGIWSAASNDNGYSWTVPLRLTDSNTVSHRFPCISDVQVPGSPRDTVVVSYMMDLQAGFDIQGQGHATENPVVCQFVPTELLGVKADETVRVSGAALGPTILRGVLYLPPSPNPLPGGEGQRVRGQNLLVDALGRKVMDLKPGDNDVSRLAPGVYFVRGKGRGARDAGVSEKVVIAR